MKPKQVLATIMTFLLLMAYLPLLQVSAFQPPVIQLVSINGQTSTTVYAQEGEISYTIIGQSYSSNGKANVTFSIKNMDTQEVTQVYSQWLANSPNSGTFTLQEGTYEATVTAVDEEGRTSQPYVVTIIVGGDTDVATVSIEPNPIQVQHDGDLKEVMVTFENKGEAPQTVEVGWRWMDETVWHDIQTITLPSKFNSLGKTTVSFTIPGYVSRQYVFAVDPHDTLTEADEGNNELIGSVQYSTPDFYLPKITLTDKTETHVTLSIFAGQKALEGVNQIYTPQIRYGFGQQLEGQTQASLQPGEEKALPNIILPKPPVSDISFTARINDPKTIDEMELANNSRTINLNLLEDLNLAALSITSGVAYEGEEVTTVVTVSNEVGTMDKDVDVVLRLNGNEIGREPVHILPGEEKNVTFTWEAPGTGGGNPVTHQLEAEINPAPRELEEITYDDNIVRASIVILPEFEGKTCPPNSNRTSAISGYYEYYCDCTPLGGCSICVGTYSESITVTPVGPTPPKVKAGMGFEYQYQVRYFNDNPNNGSQHGFEEVEAEFDEDQDLPSVQLVPTQLTRQANETWSMPRAKIQRGQGDVEMIEYLPTLEELHVNPDEYVDGGNKYYTSFYQKDGHYNFTVTGRRAGVTQITYTDINGDTHVQSTISPRLTVCTPGSYEIDGSPHDDYIIRRVDPNIPFPQNDLHGWDWDGYEYILYDLSHWWNTYGREKDGVNDETWIMELE